ncbi:MAG: Shikimate kinase 1 [Chlamydiales bacterium]|nr:Shikimate kinase 1 [Chlamydiales bacterium]
MILCGLFCAGKSTLGKAVAEAKNLPFYDTDRLIEAKEGGTVSEIWLRLGPEMFRDVETAVVFSLKREPCVVATGGGTLLREENRKHLRRLGKTVYLKASTAVLWSRLQQRGLPAFLDKENPKEHLNRIAKERIPLFEQFCTYVLETEFYSLEEEVRFLSG